MPIASMTGFARASGERQGLFWQWEIKSVNGKALDVRLRLPSGFEALETPVRAALASAFRRGNLQVSLSISGQVARETVRLNQDILDRLVDAGEALRERIGGEPLRADVLLSIKGVVEVAAAPEEEGEAEARNAAMLECFGEALASLAGARREEGDRLNAIVSAQVRRIAELADAPMTGSAPAATLTGAMGRAPSYAEVRDALLHAGRARFGAIDPLDPHELDSGVVSHRERFASPEWTWRR